MIPEAAYAMLACARIGAVHSVVFGGFSPDSLADRINDCDSQARDHRRREACAAASKVPLKANADEALTKCRRRRQEHAGVPAHRRPVAMEEGRDLDATSAMRDGQSADCPPEPMNAEDPLFILYTSGSTGKPKGVLHTTGGYLVYASMTHEYVFDYQRRRHLLVHGRRRLGDRAQLHRLRPARQRRHDADVRGHAELSRPCRASGRSSTSTRSRSSTPRRPRSAR